MEKYKPGLTLFLALMIGVNVSYAGPFDFIFGGGKKCGTIGDSGNIVTRYLENRKFFKDQTWKARVVEERNPEYLNDLDYMEETKYVNSTLGIVDTRFDPELDTQIFFTQTAKPLADGTIPVVDPEAKALVVYFHGSGTAKASGVGFAGKMNALAKLGYSSLSFDLPFHRLGSRNPALADTENFAKYVNSVLEKYRVPGQKVILVGHSFGPDVIAEYITRYPKGADSAVLVSPGGFDDVTKKWYEEKTEKMDFGDTEMNDAGGRWAGMVTTENMWNKPNTPGRVDPTKANPDLDVYVISGDKEEYIPGELDARGMPTDKPREYDVEGSFKNFFSRVDVTIEPGVGHYIFNHKDAQGQDVVLRSVLKANGESLANEKNIKMDVTNRFQSRSSIDIIQLRYSKEPFFRRYVDQLAAQQGTTGRSLIQNLKATDDKKNSQGLITNYGWVEKQRVQALNSNIKATEKWAPAFYAENKAAIDALGEKGADTTVIQAKYNSLLQSLPPEQVRAHASVKPEVYVLPERPQRQEFNPNDRRPGNQQQQQRQQQRPQQQPRQPEAE